ncbi:MAG: glycosyltransferase family 4 protein [Neomegalonema sp.]|nr:glycosyltransferase family 4 protein [Neomegalonema sp.]
MTSETMAAEEAALLTKGLAASGEIWLFLDSGGVGGIETHVKALYLAFRRAGASARIVLLQEHAGNPWLEQLRAVDAEPLILEGGFTSILRALRARRPAVLHTHGYKAGIFGRLAAKLAGVPVVSTFHAGERAPGKVGLYQRLDEWTSILSRRIAVSPPIQAHLPYRSTLIANFIMTPDEAPAAPLPPVVAFVGRLSAEKGPDHFCRLAAAAAASDLEWRVYGDGPMRAELEAEFGDRVRFFGVVSNMDAVWREVGLLAMTSRAEGLPMAALEAGAAGIPILATSVGALPQVIEHGATGWLIPPSKLEAGDYAEPLAALSDWRARLPGGAGDLRRACWARVRENYSETAALRQIRDEYRAAGWRDA